MSGNIYNLYAGIAGVKQDFKVDWKEDAKADWKVDWASVPVGGLAAPVNTALPTVSGIAVVGETLSANAGTWSGNPHATFTYAWASAGTPVPGATTSSYAVLVGDVGNNITVAVTGANSQGQSSATSANFGPVLAMPVGGNTEPLCTVDPAISGSAILGSTLTVSTGTWEGSPTFAYQWTAGGQNITGATANSYVARGDDIGFTLGCIVKGVNAFGTTIATALDTAIVAPLNVLPANTTLPVISGQAVVNQILSVTTGTWTGYPTPTFTHQWYSAGILVPGATFATYEVQSSDVGHVMTCYIIGTNTSGSVTAITAPTSAVLTQPPILPAIASAPVLSGSTVHSNPLNVTTGTWTGYPAPTFTYAWSNSSTGVISGATANTYTTQTSDVGNIVSVTVTASNVACSATDTVSTAVAIS
jgi:hypothetical protein